MLSSTSLKRKLPHGSKRLKFGAAAQDVKMFGIKQPISALLSICCVVMLFSWLIWQYLSMASKVFLLSPNPEPIALKKSHDGNNVAAIVHSTRAAAQQQQRVSSSSLNDNHDEYSSYKQEFARLTRADPRKPTLGYAALTFYSGYRNAAMTFNAFMIFAYDNNFTQVLLPTLRWKDLFGTNKRLLHEDLFDVVHWNQNFATSRSNNDDDRPPLPRLVVHDASMVDFNINKSQWEGDFHQATKPFASGFQNKLMTQYTRYTKHLAQKKIPARHPSDLAILQGALRPHPDLQQSIQALQTSVLGDATNKVGGYLCLHARVEPDMQKHPVCRDRKVLFLKKIVHDLYKTFPSPPNGIRHVLIAMNRQLLEQENLTENTVAADNLTMLNQLLQQGMWNGAVSVHLAGRSALPKDSFFAQHYGISGAMADFVLATESAIFVGTEISSFSIDVMASRYHQGQRPSFMYTASSVNELVPVGLTSEPPRFDC